MKNTDHHRVFLHNPNVLVVFSGCHTYASATWYSNPNLASTWNYMSVYARGMISFLDESGLEKALRKTTLHFENYDQESPTVFNNLPSDFKQKAMKAIVAFEIEVTGMDHAFKLSQDKDAESYQNIMDELKNQGEDGRAIADEMAKRRNQVFRDD